MATDSDVNTARRFIVIQAGARMHYAVPALLDRARMLERFYTDIHAGDWPVRLGLSWWPPALRPKPVERLLGRRLPGIASKTTSVPVSALLQQIGMADCEAHLRQLVLQRGFGKANALYTLSNGDLPVVMAARAAGIYVVHEQILNPDVGRILHEERDYFSGMETQDSPERIAEDEERDRRQWNAADLLLAPSEFVRNGMIRMGAAAGKTAVVEYGVSENWLAMHSEPVEGRVLFVGSVGLRKGNHYLAAASRILHRRGVRVDVRVAGPGGPAVARHLEFQGPTYLGQVPRIRVAEEFRRADLFVLPTVSEGSAVVHLEALGCGVPVITTPNCGSVVRDGVDGFLVPIRDAEELANKIETIVTDRRLRGEMSRNARERAREFTWARYGERLLDAIRQPRESVHV